MTSETINNPSAERAYHERACRAGDRIMSGLRSLLVGSHPQGNNKQCRNERIGNGALRRCETSAAT